MKRSSCAKTLAQGGSGIRRCDSRVRRIDRFLYHYISAYHICKTFIFQIKYPVVYYIQKRKYSAEPDLPFLRLFSFFFLSFTEFLLDIFPCSVQQEFFVPFFLNTTRLCIILFTYFLSLRHSNIIQLPHMFFPNYRFSFSIPMPSTPAKHEKSFLLCRFLFLHFFLKETFYPLLLPKSFFFYLVPFVTHHGHFFV